MKTYLLIGLKITLLTLILFGVVYPLIVTGISKIIGPNYGAGEVVVVDGKTVGFAVIGQSFESDKYFNGRPSAVHYNAAATGGSNKGTNNPDYLEQVEERINVFISRNPGIQMSDIPVDLVTASGGGLDPHISPNAARVQVPRIAKERGLSIEALQGLVDQYTERPLFNLFGTSRVHVLNLNLALDKMSRRGTN